MKIDSKMIKGDKVMKVHCNVEANLSEEDFDILVEYFNVDTTQDIAEQKQKVADMLKWIFKKKMEETTDCLTKLEIRID